MLTYLFLRETSSGPWALFPMVVYASFWLFLIDAGMVLGMLHFSSLFLHWIMPTLGHASMAPAQWPGTFGVTEPIR